MTTLDKNIWILENVYHYPRYYLRNYPYWTKNKDEVCYTLADDFYPSNSDDNRFVPDYYNNMNYAGPLIDMMRVCGTSVSIEQDDTKAQAYTMTVGNRTLSSGNLANLIVDHLLILNGKLT